MWYTDSSKSGGTGTKIYGSEDGQRFSILLGRLATVFQVNVIAILACSQNSHVALAVTNKLVRYVAKITRTGPQTVVGMAELNMITQLLTGDASQR